MRTVGLCKTSTVLTVVLCKITTVTVGCKTSTVLTAALRYLAMVDQLLVKQEVNLIEAVLPYESKNNYSVQNSAGQKIYYASEDSNFCCRQCCGPKRPWTVHVWSVLVSGLSC